MSDAAAVLDPGPAAVFTPEQLDDLATLFAYHLPRGNMVWLATTMKVTLAGAANEVDDSAFARAVLRALAEAGRVSDALTLLRQDAKASYLTLGISHVLMNQRLATAAQYQAFINRYQPFIASEDFMRTFPRVARTVCAIGIGGAIRDVVGTGFLVGPDLVLTNAHVIAPLLDLTSDPPQENGAGGELTFFFDYISDPAPHVPHKKDAPGVFTAVNAVPAEWLRAARAPLPNDGTPHCPPDANNLFDYALIRLEQKIGLLPSRRSGGEPRGWLDVPAAIAVNVPNQRIVVHQHPGAAPLQFDIGDYMGLDPTGTRVRYTVSTAHGSSGGAAVDLDGSLFALHNAEVQGVRQNQGVRIDKISADLVALDPQWNQFPPLNAQPFWSLSESADDPKPVIGRDEFRQNVVAMLGETAPRVMAVWGPPGCGLRYSVKLLRRTLDPSARVVEYSADNLMTFTPERFVQKLISGIGLTGTASDPMPKPNATENLPRWLRLDLPSWIARRLAQFGGQTPSAVPVWLVLNTAVEDFIWADNLGDFVAALAGVHDAGQMSIEQPHLRFVFLASSPATLPLAGVPRFDDDLTSYTTHGTDFVQCLSRAWYAFDKNVVMQPPDAWIALAETMVLGKAPTERRKILSDLVRNLVMTRLAQG